MKSAYGVSMPGSSWHADHSVDALMGQSQARAEVQPPLAQVALLLENFRGKRGHNSFPRQPLVV